MEKLELPEPLLLMMYVWRRIKKLEGGTDLEAELFALHCALARLGIEVEKYFENKKKAA